MSFRELKQALQHRLVTGDRHNWTEASPRAIRDGLIVAAQELVSQGVEVPTEDLSRVIDLVTEEIAVFGPLHPLLHDGTVTEIMVNGTQRVFVQRDGRNEQTEVRVESPERLRSVVEHIVGLDNHKRLDNALPFADVAGPDGCRINLAIPPVVVGGPHITIRKFSGGIQTLDDLVSVGALDDRMAMFLAACVAARVNILFTGPAGAGKTTLLEQLATVIDPSERIVVIEDTLELRFGQPDVVRMLTRSANVEGRGELGIRELFRNALRMSPTRIILGEIRGDEALDYLQALSSGHKGSLAILHAASPEEGLARLENLARLSGVEIPVATVRRQIAYGIDLVVQLDHLIDGSRKVTRVSEVKTEHGADGVDVVDLFHFEPGPLADGAVTGEFVADRHIPEFHDLFSERGLTVDRAVYGL